MQITIEDILTSYFGVLLVSQGALEGMTSLFSPDSPQIT